MKENTMKKVIEARHHLHQNPELSTKEEKTAAYVSKLLTEAGVPHRTGVGGHGIVAEVKGTGIGNSMLCCALRADMDALPLKEETGLSFCSINDGVSHACGHDMHTAMLIGAGIELMARRGEFAGTVKLVFQPAEENNPVGGAPAMIADGALDGIQVMFGQHVWPALETGKIALKKGAIMGASDRFFVTVTGKAAHGSEPDKGIDAILTAAHIITALQSVVSRNVSPLDAVVVSVGEITGGVRYNVIPYDVKFSGTVRTLTPQMQDRVAGRIEAIAKSVAESFCAAEETKYVKGYPPVLNDDDLAGFQMDLVKKYFPAGTLLEVEKPAMGGEDFSFFGEKIPVCFAWLGCRPNGIKTEDFPPIHNQAFNGDEDCMPLGVEFFVRSAIEWLNK